MADPGEAAPNPGGWGGGGEGKGLDQFSFQKHTF